VMTFVYTLMFSGVTIANIVLLRYVMQRQRWGSKPLAHSSVLS
jgi:hypothetical protein